MADDIRAQLAQALMGMTDGAHLPLDPSKAAQMQAFAQAAMPGQGAPTNTLPGQAAPSPAAPIQGGGQIDSSVLGAPDGSHLPNSNGLTPEQIDFIRKQFSWLLPNNPKTNKGLQGAVQGIPNSNVRGIDPNQVMQNY